MADGVVEGIYISTAAKAPVQSIDEVQAVAGTGLLGDRYANGSGTYWHTDKPGQDLTLIEAETIECLAADLSIALAPGDARRNIVTRGIRLKDLLGQRFLIGDVECSGIRDCPPCSHLEALTEPGVRLALEGSGGLRSDIVVSGRIAVGDTIRLLP